VGLSDLDDRLLPPWARRVQSARATAAAVPTPAQALRGLDDRYAADGPLRVVRDAPVLGALVAVAVLLAGAGTGVALSLSTAGAVAAGPRPVVLGPPLGADAEASLAQAHAAAVERSRTAPGTRALALVSLSEQVTAGEVAGLLVESTLEVRRALVRAPVEGTPELLTVEVAGDPPRTLRALQAAAAQRKSEEARELARQAATTPQGAQRSSYEQAAATAGREAAAYAADCACVLALLVEGTAAELAELPALPVVRGVELAPRGTAAGSVELRPLAPGVTGVVR
jgi:hypothetical protein